MNRILTGAALLLSVPLAFSLQQPQSQNPQTQNPPYRTPPTLPDNRPQTQQPPAEQQTAPASSADIQDQIQRTLSKDPALSDAQVSTTVDEQTITLTGTVQDETQHQRVLQLVQSYSGPRKIDDKLVVKQKS